MDRLKIYLKALRVRFKRLLRKNRQDPITSSYVADAVMAFGSYFFVVSIFIYALALPLFVISLIEAGVEIKGAGGIAAASIVGGFAFLTNLNSVESNIRNLREKWLDDLRGDFSEYISSSRKVIKKSREYGVSCRVEKNGRVDVEKSIKEDVDSKELDIMLKNLEKKEEKVREGYRELSDAKDEFFNLFGKINIKVRGRKAGPEIRLHKNLHSHFNFYNKIIVRSSGGKDINKYDFSSKDTFLADCFSKYFNKEWGRIKSGESDIKFKKMVTGFSMLSIIISYGIYSAAITGEMDASTIREGFLSIFS